jgi:uncharacterized protein (DUF4415 family)
MNSDSRGNPGLENRETLGHPRDLAHLRARETSCLSPDLFRVDHDVVEWLKKAGSGYQTGINAILRSYMKAQAE